MIRHLQIFLDEFFPLPTYSGREDFCFLFPSLLIEDGRPRIYGSHVRSATDSGGFKWLIEFFLEDVISAIELDKHEDTLHKIYLALYNKLMENRSRFGRYKACDSLIRLLHDVRKKLGVERSRWNKVYEWWLWGKDSF